MNEAPPPPYPAPVKKSGKKWVLFGCGGCLGLLVLAVGGLAVFVYGVTQLIKSADPYKVAVQRAQESAEVQTALGTPVEPAMWVLGSVNVSGESGSADFATTLSGPKATGSLVVKAAKSAGTWTYSIMEVQVVGGEKIQLLDATP